MLSPHNVSQSFACEKNRRLSTPIVVSYLPEALIREQNVASVTKGGGSMSTSALHQTKPRNKKHLTPIPGVHTEQQAKKAYSENSNQHNRPENTLSGPFGVPSPERYSNLDSDITAATR